MNIALEEFKDSLGPLASSLTPEEIIKLRDLEDRIADVVFDGWIKKRRIRMIFTRIIRNAIHRSEKLHS